MTKIGKFIVTESRENRLPRAREKMEYELAGNGHWVSYTRFLFRSNKNVLKLDSIYNSANMKLDGILITL